MKKGLQALIILLSIAGLSSRALAQQADFSGDWQLNKGKGDFGQQDAEKVTPKELKVKQQSDAITIEKVIISDGKDNSYAETFTFDGKPTKKILGDSTSGTHTRLTTVKWSADKKKLSLSASTTVDLHGQTGMYTTEQNWALSPDGKTLTIENNTVLPDRKVVFTAVYEKQ